MPVFLMAGYSEALFLGLAIPAWLAAKRDHCRVLHRQSKLATGEIWTLRRAVDDGNGIGSHAEPAKSVAPATNGASDWRCFSPHALGSRR